MAVNRSTVVDDDDDRSDWIELFNPSGTSVNLKGWALTDDPTHQTKWTFPNVTLGSRACTAWCLPPAKIARS